MFGDDMGPRRLLALLRWLPHDAAAWEGEAPSWTTELELGAMTVELLHNLNRSIAKMSGAKRVGQPLRVPRPTEQRRRGRGFDHDGFMRALASMTPKG